MPYDETLDARIKTIVSPWEQTENKKMFGGVCHLYAGHMFCGVHKDWLILRLGETAAEKAFQQPFVKPFDITGRPMKGWVMVAAEGFATDAQLKQWLKQAKQFVTGLPPK
ncbi:MAG: TfoX/Sxy family protein [Deltaproteobacteria bacterium]|nr:TfoX/Sxy family protein [Deltaproteobacteria bacterium]